MTRTLRRYFTWVVLLMGCTSQPFCDFRDTAPIAVLPSPEHYASGGDYGSIMVPLHLDHPDVEEMGDYVGATAGGGSQVEVIRVALGDDLTLSRSPQLQGICEAQDQEDEESTCWERRPGVGLGYRSTWDDGEQCVAVGMGGHDRGSGVGFWCAMGTRHRREAFFLSTLNDHEMLVMTHMLQPQERIFAGTNHSLQMLDASSQAFDRVVWDAGVVLPTQAHEVEALSTLETDAVPAGYLLAIGYPDEGKVLVGSVASDDDGDGNADLTPYACISMDTPGFGSVLKLAELTPGDAPVLITGISWGYRNEVPSPQVHIFDLDLTIDPADVTCTEPDPAWTIGCDNQIAEDEGVDLDCDVEQSGFGAALDVGNIDDTAALELVVGCPGATVDGFDSAGAGYVYRPATDGTAALQVLIDSGEQRADDCLGAGVLIAPVGNRNEPVLAAPGETRLLMFLCTGLGNEPPHWDSPYYTSNSLEDPRCRDPQR